MQHEVDMLVAQCESDETAAKFHTKAANAMQDKMSTLQRRYGEATTRATHSIRREKVPKVIQKKNEDNQLATYILSCV